MLKIAEFFYKKISLNWLLFCTFNFEEIVAENAGNRVLDFKIFQGRNSPGPPYLLLVINFAPVMDPPLVTFNLQYIHT